MIEIVILLYKRDKNKIEYGYMEEKCHSLFHAFYRNNSLTLIHKKNF